MNNEDKTKIKDFLSQTIKNYDLQDDEDIFAKGLVNSLFAMQLVMFVEQEFGVSVDNEDLELDNFRSINALLQFVTRKKGVVPQS